jgi:hypothetical protein
MTLTIKKRNKRNRQKYAIIGIQCEMGSPIMYIKLTSGKVKEFVRHELEIAELDILHNKYHYFKSI